MANSCELRVTALSGGILYDINTLNAGYILVDYDGLGISDIARLSQSGPFQQGDTDLGFDQAARFITLVWELQQGTNVDLWTLRSEILGIFRARVNDPIQLVFALPNGDTRAADVNLDGSFDMPRSDRSDGRTQRAAVSLKASDPRLYDPTQKIVSFNLLETFGGWNIEETGQTTSDGWNIEETGQTTLDGWNIGVGTLNVTQAILYANGSIFADIEYPVIRVFGPFTDLVITNNATGEKLDFTANGGLAMSAGEFVEIDLRYEGGKTVINQAGDSVAQYLSDDSDLVTWHLSYNTELIDASTQTRSDGNNIIQVSALGVSLSTRVDIIYFDRYIGS